MKYFKQMMALLVVMLLGFTSVADAAKPNWKKGRIYYRMVCTDCHADHAGRKISPSEKTKAEWIDYFEKDIHGPDDASKMHAVSYFFSKEYRENIKATNRAAAKMINVPAEQLKADVKAFVIHTAKDSDQPSRCE